MEVREDVEVCWCLRLGAGCIVCRCVADVDIGGRPQASRVPGILVADRFERRCREHCGDVSGNAAVSGGCGCMTRLFVGIAVSRRCVPWAVRVDLASGCVESFI